MKASRRFILCGIFVVWQVCVTLASMPGQSIEGKWQGILDLGSGKLRIAFNIKKTEKGYSATMDSIDQGAMSLPVSEVIYSGKNIEMKLPNLRAFYKGTVDLENDTMTGVWNQSGYSLPLTLKKTSENTELNRPQHPRKPFPYHEEDITFKSSDTVTLSGTFTYPEKGEAFTAVVLISGSGPQDRDETVFGHKPFLVLADYLTRMGFAVLRYDDRGTGKSTGNFNIATSEDFAEDAGAAVTFLKSRSDVKTIGLLGHSEGGIIAPMVASKNHDISFIVLLSGPGVSGDIILMDQSRLIQKAQGVPQEVTDIITTQQKIEFSELRKTQNIDSARKNMEKASLEYLNTLKKDYSQYSIGEKNTKERISIFTTPWFRFFLTYDPAPALESLNIPVLALFGDKDLQVPFESNKTAIEQSLKKAGNTRFTCHVFKGKNHLYQNCKTGIPSEYATIEQTIAPDVLEFIANWIKKSS